MAGSFQGIPEKLRNALFYMERRQTDDRFRQREVFIDNKKTTLYN